jgi:hypothetical protein
MQQTRLRRKSEKAIPWGERPFCVTSTSPAPSINPKFRSTSRQAPCLSFLTTRLAGHVPSAMNAGGPTLAAFLFLRLGWDTANAPCPVHAPSFWRMGGKPRTPTSRVQRQRLKPGAGCPILESFLDSRVGNREPPGAQAPSAPPQVVTRLPTRTLETPKSARNPPCST